MESRFVRRTQLIFYFGINTLKELLITEVAVRCAAHAAVPVTPYALHAVHALHAVFEVAPFQAFSTFDTPGRRVEHFLKDPVSTTTVHCTSVITL